MSQLQRQKEKEKEAAAEAARQRELEQKRMVRAASRLCHACTHGACPVAQPAMSHCAIGGYLLPSASAELPGAKVHVQGAFSAWLQVTEDSYTQLVDTENVNVREPGEVDARSIEAALTALSTSEGTPEDRHPERCVFLVLACMCMRHGTLMR